MNYNIVSALALKNAEQSLMKSGVTEDELIFRASTALANRVKEVALGGKILVVAGRGNNGCDGLECAIILSKRGEKVKVLDLSDGATGNKKRIDELKTLGVPFVDKVESGEYAVIIDAIFGIGLSREVQGKYLDAINQINKSNAYIISADIPSGLDADDGFTYGATVNANETVTFTAVKSGMILGLGRNYCGEITVAEIGIGCESLGTVVQKNDAVMEKRLPSSHKGNYGRVSVIGGCDTMVGAPLMAYESAEACARSGAGLTTLCVAKENKCAYQSRVKETMLCFLPSKKGKIKFNKKSLLACTKNANAVVVGPGMTSCDETRKVVEWLANDYDGTLVIDADGLNSIASNLNAIKNHRCKMILTPHVGEFNRLSRESGTIVDRAKALAKSLNCVVAVKSATTVITDGDCVKFNVTGTPALSKGGSGDVLSGMVGALACVKEPFEAMVTACYHFGRIAEKVSKKMNSEVSVLASDIILEMEMGESNE